MEIFSNGDTLKLMTPTKGIRLVWTLQVKKEMMIMFLLNILFQAVNIFKKP